MKISSTSTYLAQARKATITNLDVVTRGLVTNFEQAQPISMAQVTQLSESMDENLDLTSDADLVFLKAKALIDEGKSYQGLKYYLEQLSMRPCDLVLQLRLDEILTSTRRLMESKMDRDIGDLEIGPTFELLQLTGRVGAEHMVMAIRHYNQVDELKKAEGLALRMVKTKPMMPMLQDELKRIVSALESSELKAYIRNPRRPKYLPMKRPALTLNEAKALMVFQSGIELDHKDPDGLQITLKQIETVVGSNSNYFNPSFKILYYYKAMILDYLGRFTEAIELLYSLKCFSPAEIYFQRSFKVTLSRFNSHLLDVAAKNPADAAIESGYLLIKDIYYVDYKLSQAYAKYLYGVGRSDEGYNILLDLMELNPYDFDYILAAMAASQGSKDEKISNVISERLVKLQKLHPWNLAFTVATEKIPVAFSPEPIAA